MAALTKERDTKRWGGGGPERLYELPQAASTVIYKGALVALNGTGLVVPFTSAAGLRRAGRAEQSRANGAGDNTRVRFSSGIFKWTNDTTTPVTSAMRGQDVYGLDDNTVTADATGRSVAGKCVDVDSDGVWVDTQFTP